jgi:hypothetical protein
MYIRTHIHTHTHTHTHTHSRVTVDAVESMNKGVSSASAVASSFNSNSFFFPVTYDDKAGWIYIHTCMHTNKNAYTHTYVCTYIHPPIHPSINNTYIHTHVHIAITSHRETSGAALSHFFYYYKQKLSRHKSQRNLGRSTLPFF